MTHNLRLIVLLTDYKNNHPVAHLGTEIPFTVTITPSTCDCSLITWDDPVNQFETATVKLIPNHTFHIIHATVNEASK